MGEKEQINGNTLKAGDIILAAEQWYLLAAVWFGGGGEPLASGRSLRWLGVVDISPVPPGGFLTRYSLCEMMITMGLPLSARSHSLAALMIHVSQRRWQAHAQDGVGSSGWNFRRDYHQGHYRDVRSSQSLPIDIIKAPVPRRGVQDDDHRDHRGGRPVPAMV